MQNLRNRRLDIIAMAVEKNRKLTKNLDIKQQNRMRIFNLLYKSSGLSRQEIASQLQLSLPTVTNNLSELMNEGLIEETGFVGNTGGRNARIYSIVSNARTAIGLDITRHHITAIAVGLDGQMLDTIRIRYDFELSDTYKKRLGEIVEQLISQANLERDRILGVGLGVPGLVSEDCQRIFYGKILDFGGTTCRELGKYIDFNCSLFNDANAAGFAEFWNHEDIQNAFYIMLSNNVGGAIIQNGTVYSGKNICAGEIGHIKLDNHGPLCYCGQRGCVDVYCAATVLSSGYDGNLPAFFADLEKGDAKARQLWDVYLDNLAKTINTIRLLYDCTIILGGYVGAYLDSYMEDLRSRVAALDSFDTPLEDIITCHYKNQSIAAGAALNFISKFIDRL